LQPLSLAKLRPGSLDLNNFLRNIEKNSLQGQEYQLRIRRKEMKINGNHAAKQPLYRGKKRSMLGNSGTMLTRSGVDNR
jgi:hypothetical protein